MSDARFVPHGWRNCTIVTGANKRCDCATSATFGHCVRVRSAAATRLLQNYQQKKKARPWLPRAAQDPVLDEDAVTHTMRVKI